MEAFGILGFAMGSTGVTFAIIAWGQISGLKNELDELKKSLDVAGVLSPKAGPADN